MLFSGLSDRLTIKIAYICTMTYKLKKMNALIAMPAIACLVMACGGASRDEKEKIEHEIQGFSEAYFNFRLHDAAGYCTADSKKWIMYFASNITEHDLETLRSKESDATVRVTDIRFNEADSTGTACITVSNAMILDSIGKPGRVADEAEYKLNFVCNNGRYRVRMAGPLRNER